MSDRLYAATSASSRSLKLIHPLNSSWDDLEKASKLLACALLSSFSCCCCCRSVQTISFFVLQQPQPVWLQTEDVRLECLRRAAGMLPRVENAPQQPSKRNTALLGLPCAVAVFSHI